MTEQEARAALLHVLAARSGGLAKDEAARLAAQAIILVGMHFQQKVIPAMQMVGNLFSIAIERTAASFAQFGRLYLYSAVMARHRRRAEQLRVLALPAPQEKEQDDR
jgi:hypothetical protein